MHRGHLGTEIPSTKSQLTRGSLHTTQRQHEEACRHLQGTAHIFPFHHRKRLLTWPAPLWHSQSLTSARVPKSLKLVAFYRVRLETLQHHQLLILFQLLLLLRRQVHEQLGLVPLGLVLLYHRTGFRPYQVFMQGLL